MLKSTQVATSKQKRHVHGLASTQGSASGR
jgi:hypothetical protein